MKRVNEPIQSLQNRGHWVPVVDALVEDSSGDWFDITDDANGKSAATARSTLFAEYANRHLQFSQADGRYFVRLRQ